MVGSQAMRFSSASWNVVPRGCIGWSGPHGARGRTIGARGGATRSQSQL